MQKFNYNRGMWMLRFFYSTVALSALLCFASIKAETSVNQLDLMIVIANSASMKNHDPDALTSQAIGRFLTDVDANSGTRIAILGFNDYASIISPFAFIDPATIETLKQKISALNPQGSLSNAAAAVERSIYEFKTHSRPTTKKVMVLITDTNIHTLNPDDDKKFEKWLREILVNDAISNHIQIYGIGIGADADTQSLQILAQQTGGKAYQVATALETQSRLDDIRQKLYQSTLREAQDTERSVQQPVHSNTASAPTITNTPLTQNESTTQSTLSPAAKLPDFDSIPPRRNTVADAPADRLEPGSTAPPQSESIGVETTVSNWIRNQMILLAIAALMIVAITISGIIWKQRQRKKNELNASKNANRPVARPQNTHELASTLNHAEVDNKQSDCFETNSATNMSLDKTILDSRATVNSVKHSNEEQLKTLFNLQTPTHHTDLPKTSEAEIMTTAKGGTEELPLLTEVEQKPIPDQKEIGRTPTPAKTNLDSDKGQNADEKPDHGSTEEIAAQDSLKNPDNPALSEVASEATPTPQHAPLEEATFRPEELPPTTDADVDDRTTLRPIDKKP